MPKWAKELISDGKLSPETKAYTLTNRVEAVYSPQSETLAQRAALHAKTGYITLKNIQDAMMLFEDGTIVATFVDPKDTANVRMADLTNDIHPAMKTQVDSIIVEHSILKSILSALAKNGDIVIKESDIAENLGLEIDYKEDGNVHIRSVAG